MRFYILGPLEVVSSTGPVVIRAKRPRALLAILLLHTAQVVPIDRIIDGIWPDKPPQSAVENIRTYVHQLRALLRQTSGRGRLESYPGGYRLIADPDELDLLRFNRLAADGRRALQVGDFASAAVLLGEAIGLWRGAPLPELDLGRAIRGKTVAIEEQRWRVQGDWISARLALGEHAELVATLRELIGERPLDESLWCALVTALYSMGRTGEALAAIGEARQLFITELGIEPGPELNKIQAAVLRGDEALGTPGIGARVVLPGEVTPHQLPEIGSAFVGREEQLRRIRDLIQHPCPNPDQAKVVVVNGPPGVGKSALAVTIAHHLRTALPDGQLYVDLGGSTNRPLDTGQALAHLLSGFGVRPDAIGQSVESRRSVYRSLVAGRRMVIVLDDASATEQVLPLLPSPGQSLVIVASRRWLTGLDADVRVHLDELTRAEALRMLANAIGTDRIHEDPVAANAIVDACGRLPSAIKIAGARLAARPNHPLGLLARRLTEADQLVDELSLEGLSIRKAFEASYETLDAQGRRCFRILSMFPSDHIVAAGLGQVLDLPVRDADRALERLVHAGLLSTGMTHHGTPSFRMPRLLHAFARERLAMEGPEVRLQNFGAVGTP